MSRYRITRKVNLRKVKVSLKQLVNSASALQQLSNHPVDQTMTASESFALGTLIGIVEPHLTNYNLVRNKALPKYADPVTSEESKGKNLFKFKSDEEQEKFNAEIAALEAQEVSLRIPKFTMAQMAAWGLTPYQLATVSFCLKDAPQIELEE